MCLSRTRGDQPLDTMGHSGATKHDRMCSVEHDASPGEKRRGTMVYMLTTPTCTSSIAQLRVRVCGVGSRRERVRAAPGLIVRLVTSCPCSEALLDNEDGILLSHSIRVHMRLVMSQKSAEVFIDEWKDVAFLDIGSVQIECWLQEVFVTSACSIISM